MHFEVPTLGFYQVQMLTETFNQLQQLISQHLGFIMRNCFLEWNLTYQSTRLSVCEVQKGVLTSFWNASLGLNVKMWHKHLKVTSWVLMIRKLCRSTPEVRSRCMRHFKDKLNGNKIFLAWPTLGTNLTCSFMMSFESRFKLSF